MPTPFYHLSIAEEVLARAELPKRVRRFLEEQQGPFFLGNTAPDVQVVSGQLRKETHFFDFPLLSWPRPPWEQCLLENPSLACAPELPPARAAFISGYLCHLQADWFWAREIFVPIFGLDSAWGTFTQRLYFHNVLRAYLDRQILPLLTDGTARALSQVQPAGWLPFVNDSHLQRWRDLLVVQLHPGASIQTVDVFAARQGIPPQEFYRLLDSPEELEQKVFSHVSHEQLEHYRRHLVEENLRLIQAYLGNRHSDSAYGVGRAVRC